MVNSIDVIGSTDFLKALFATRDLGWLEFRTFEKGGRCLQHWISLDQPFDTSKFPPDLDIQDKDIYFGVCPRKSHLGTKDGIAKVTTFWADVDAKDFDNDKSKALAAIKACPLPPSIIVDSGNGYHGYWLLHEPEEISTIDKREFVELLLRRLAGVVCGDSSVAEVARIMRLPGSYNWKNPEHPLPVDLVEFVPERRYSLLDFEVLPVQQVELSRAARNDVGWVTQTLGNLRDGNRNVTFTKIAGKLRRDGWDAEGILALLSPIARECGFPEVELGGLVNGLVSRYLPNDPISNSHSIYGEKLENGSRGIKTVSFGKLVEKKYVEPIWLVDRIAPVQGVVTISGPGGCGKTWMLLDLAIAVATGTKWLGQIECQQGSVLYIDEESSERLLTERLAKMATGRSLDTSGGLPIEFAVQQGVLFDNEVVFAILVSAIEELKPSLIIVDSLVRVHRADENSSVAMAAVFSKVKELVRDSNRTVVIADHQRKPGAIPISPEHLVRGSSEKLAFADSLLVLQKRSSGERTVKHVKSRYGQEIEAFEVEILDTDLNSTVVRYCGCSKDMEEKTKYGHIREFVLEELSADQGSRSRQELIDLGKAQEIAVKQLDHVLKQMTKQQVIQAVREKPSEGRGGLTTWYSLVRADESV